MFMQVNKIWMMALMLACGALGVALASQYLLGANPCELCILQRYPYVVVMLVSATAIIFTKLKLAKLQIAKSHHEKPQHSKAQYICYILVVLAFFATSAIAAYHVGVEQLWIDAPESCSTKLLQSGSLEQLKASILSAPKVSCKDVGASFAGISMASWNMIYGISAIFIIRYLWNKQAKQMTS